MKTIILAYSYQKNPILSQKSKHIDVKYHYVREKVQTKEINLLYCPTYNMLAGGLTKPLGGPVLKSLCEKLKLGVVKISLNGNVESRQTDFAE